MKNLKVLNISGGGFAISGLAGAAEQVIKSGYNPDIISGISSGSILTFILVASKDPINVIKMNSIGFSSKVAFKHSPTNKSGVPTIRSIWNAITKNYLAEQDNLGNTLMKIVSKKEWNEYISNSASKDGIVIAVDFLTGARRKFNLKEESYEDAITIVTASCSIPVFVNPVMFRGDMLYDGGIRNHIASEWVLENYNNISDNVNIFSRPADFTKYKQLSDLDDITSILMRTIEIMTYEISKSDETSTNLISQLSGINNTNIYLPSLLKNTYDDNIDSQKLLYAVGRYNAKLAGFA